MLRSWWYDEYSDGLDDRMGHRMLAMHFRNAPISDLSLHCGFRRLVGR